MVYINLFPIDVPADRVLRGDAEAELKQLCIREIGDPDETDSKVININYGPFAGYRVDLKITRRSYGRKNHFFAGYYRWRQL